MSARGLPALIAAVVLGAAVWLLLHDEPGPPPREQPAVVRPPAAREPAGPVGLPGGAPEAPRSLAPRAGSAATAQGGPGPGPASDDAPVLSVAGSATLFGRVEDATGHPAPRAWVFAWAAPRQDTEPVETRRAPGARAQADDAGNFVLDLPVGAAGSDFTLEPGGWRAAPLAGVHGRVASGAVLESLLLNVTAARSLAGRVVTDAGWPLPDAEVEVSLPFDTRGGTATAEPGVFRGGPPGHRVTTGADGRFAVSDLPASVAQVTVRASGFPEWSAWHARDDGELDVVLAQGLSLVGAARGADGEPAAGVTVAWRRSSPGQFGRGRVTVTTDDAGRFAIHSLEPCDDGLLSFRDTAAPPRFALHVEQPVVVSSPGPLRLGVTLPPAQGLAGKVLRLDGSPVPQAPVVARGARLLDVGGIVMAPLPTWESSFPGAFSAYTDEGGAFRIDGLYADAFEVTAQDPSDPALDVVVTAEAGRQDLVLVLDPDATWGVTLSGHVRDALTGAPVPRFTVTPMLPAGQGSLMSSPRARKFEAQDGAWHVTGLQPGPVLLTVTARGYAPWSDELVDYPAGEYAVDAALLAERTLNLRVVDPARRPLKDVAVSFRDGAGEPLAVAHGPNSKTTLLHTDADGRVNAHGLPADLVVVELKPGWLGARQEASFHLRLPPAGVQELVYGEGDTLQLAVAVLAPAPGRPPPALDPTPGDSSPGAALRPLLDGLVGGALRPPLLPSTLSVREAGGALLAEIPLHRADQRVQAPLVPEAPENPWLVTLLVPRRPLVVEWHADDGSRPPVSRSWQPVPGAVGGDLVVLLLPPD